MKIVLALMMCAGVAAAQSPVRCAGPLSEQQVTSLITGRVAQARITQFITTCGVGFHVSSASEARLKRAGATEAILIAIREKTPKATPGGTSAKIQKPPVPPAPSQPSESPAEAALRAELELWNSIKESNNIDVFQDYLRTHPQGQFTAPARAKLQELTAAGLRQKTQEALRERRWDSAERNIGDLLKAVPENDEIRNWRKAISDGRDADLATADLELWNATKDSSTVQAFENYSRQYPNGKYTAAARTKIRELNAATLRSQIRDAVRVRHWDAAENEVAALLKIIPDNEEIRSWRKTISEGRAADRAISDAERRDTDRDTEMKKLKFEFVSIPAGEFVMGCSPRDNQCSEPEKPPHKIRISNAFELAKYEVTQAMWASVMGNNPSKFKSNSPDRPVEQVSWNDVHEFLRRLNQRGDGYRYRLPTEAEWEYAARAGTVEATAGDPDRLAWFGGNSGGQTHPVGQKEPNLWGLYDMLGNVSEWVEDRQDDSFYTNSPPADPRGPAIGQFRVLRGGSWLVISKTIRLSARLRNAPTFGDDQSGFRCVREKIQ